MQSNKSEVVQLIIKLGLAKDEAGAKQIAIGLIVAFLAIMLLMFFGGGGSGSSGGSLSADENPSLDPSILQP